MGARRRNSRGRTAGFLAALGPGLVTGASDDDPSGIATYAQAGAIAGMATLWTALFTFPMMWAVQFMCAKIGLVTGGGIARVLRKHYSRGLLYAVVIPLIAANTINAGVDIGATAAAIQLLVPAPTTVLVVLITAGILAFQVFGSYRLLANIFKWLTVTLLAYIFSAFVAHPDWRAVLRHTVQPSIRFDRQFLSTLVAILGTTITPYLFFWQANQEVEEELSMGRRRLSQRRGASGAELKYAGWDIATGMFASNLVMFFIILATASTLFVTGQHTVRSAADAAEALRPIAGSAATTFWAIGLIGAGVLCVPILTGSAAYALAEALNWKRGLDERPGRAKLFYAVITVSTVLGAGLSFAGWNPMRALFWTAVINGFLAPPLLVVVMLISNNRRVLGNRVNGRLANAIGWSTTALMFAAAALFALTLR